MLRCGRPSWTASFDAAPEEAGKLAEYVSEAGNPGNKARLAYAEVGPGAVWVIGCAPTALEELIALKAAPALVVGLPVGFVGAAESKAHLRASGLPAVPCASAR